MNAKIGVIDIETAPLVASAWGLFDQNIGLNQIEREWTILSFAFKPLGSKKITYKDNSKQDDPRDDSHLLPDLWNILNDYDFLVAQNGKRFDLRKIRARLILAGFVPPSPVKVLDTMLMARQVAAFTSNKLEWLADKLSNVPKSKHKEFPGFELWSECLKGNPRAWRAMKRYNIPDITSCEEVYLKLRPWYEGHPNVAVYAEGSVTACPRCASEDIEQDGYVFTNVGKYERFRCGSCGGWSRGRYTRNTLAQRKAILSS